MVPPESGWAWPRKEEKGPVRIKVNQGQSRSIKVNQGHDIVLRGYSGGTSEAREFHATAAPVRQAVARSPKKVRTGVFREGNPRQSKVIQGNPR